MQHGWAKAMESSYDEFGILELMSKPFPLEHISLLRGLKNAVAWLKCFKHWCILQTNTFYLYKISGTLRLRHGISKILFFKNPLSRPLVFYHKVDHE